MNFETNLAKLLLQIKAVKLSPENPFTWASGLKSPIYCDNRIALSYPYVRAEIIKGMVTKSNQFDHFETVAGVATAGIPHASIVAHEMGLPLIYVRSKAKAHGQKNQIEGRVIGKSVLVIEDLISTGGSALKAIDAIKEENVAISGLLAIFTYGFKESVDLFKSRQIPVQTLTNYDILIRAAIEEKYIEPNQQKVLQEWCRDPKNYYS